MTKESAGNVSDSAAKLDDSVAVCLNELLRFQRGEHLLLYTDADSDHELAEAIRSHAVALGGKAEILEIDSSAALDAQVRQLIERLEATKFDVVCELSEQYFYQTPVWQVTAQKGARIFSLAGLDQTSFVRCVGQVHHERMFQFGMALKKILHESRYIRIRTQKGTDIQMQLRAGPLLHYTAEVIKRINSYKLLRLAAGLLEKTNSEIWPPCGLLDDNVRATFLGGQLALLGIPETIEGKAVIDAYMWPPEEIGQLDDPLIITIERGKLTDIGGCAAKAKLLASWFEGQRDNVQIEHFCIGFNPGARVSGKLLEAERAWGCIVVGMGKRELHTDGVMTAPSIEADGKPILENGAFMAGELASLEKQLVRSA